MPSRFGSFIFQTRIRKRISQKSIALSVGIDPSYLASVERGRRPPPTKAVVSKILSALKMSPADQVLALEAAALDRLVLAIQGIERDIRGTEALMTLCDALPYLSEAKLSVLSALIQTLADHLAKEGVMT